MHELVHLGSIGLRMLSVFFSNSENENADSPIQGKQDENTRHILERRWNLSIQREQHEDMTPVPEGCWDLPIQSMQDEERRDAWGML